MSFPKLTKEKRKTLDRGIAKKTVHCITKYGK